MRRFDFAAGKISIRETSNPKLYIGFDIGSQHDDSIACILKIKDGIHDVEFKKNYTANIMDTKRWMASIINEFKPDQITCDAMDEVLKFPTEDFFSKITLCHFRPDPYAPIDYHKKTGYISCNKNNVEKIMHDHLGISKNEKQHPSFILAYLAYSVVGENK